MNFRTRLNSPFGPVIIVWTLKKNIPKIIQVLISHPQKSAEEDLSRLYPEAKESHHPEIEKIAQDIKFFLEGNKVTFSLDMVDMDLCSEFQQEVLMAEYGIPRGKISTYKSLARYLGRKKGARAVGNALARNPFPIIIPCHRAIRSDGSLGGFQGGIDMKRKLLENEGIRFDKNGRVQSWGVYDEYGN